MGHAPSLRRAFTLVELLVVIAIIGILVAVLVPAVQAVRESGRRATCMNNVHNMCVALQSHLSLKRFYPTNWGSATDPDNAVPTEPASRGQSWMTAILPQIEQVPLHNKIAVDEPLNYAENAQAKNNSAAAMVRISTFLCPSDLHDGTMTNQKFDLSGLVTQPNVVAVSNPQDVAVTNYKACSGANWDYDHPPVSPASSGYHDPVNGLLVTNWGEYSPDDRNKKGRNYYRTISGTSDKKDARDYGDGLICRGWGNPTDYPKLKGKPIPTSDAMIHDGLSHTFAIGECVPEYCAWSSWYWWNGSTATCAMRPNFSIGDTPRGAPDFSENWRRSWGFHSRHPGGVVFGLCGGETVFVTNDVNMAVYRAYATIDGSESAPKLSD